MPDNDYVTDLRIKMNRAERLASVHYILDNTPQVVVPRDRYDLLRFGLSGAPSQERFTSLGLGRGSRCDAAARREPGR